MSQIALTHAAFAKAKSDVQVGADRLERDRDSADQRVRGFIGAGWTGPAADSFIAAWDDWKTAADDVHQGLATMGELLDAAHRDFVRSDASSQVNLDQVAARIVDRLDG